MIRKFEKIFVIFHRAKKEKMKKTQTEFDRFFRGKIKAKAFFYFCALPRNLVQLEQTTLKIDKSRSLSVSLSLSLLHLPQKFMLSLSLFLCVIFFGRKKRGS